MTKDVNAADVAYATDRSAGGEDEVTSGNTIFYMNGRRMIRTQSSVLISSSSYLNDPRIREWIATENLRRNGVDYPLLYGMPPLIDGVMQARDIGLIEELVAEERRKNPAFDRFVGEGYLSTYTLEDLAKYPRGSVGGELYTYMVENDLSPQLAPQVLANPDWRPDNFIDFWDLRMGQTHDFFHILGEVGFSTVAEYFVTGFMNGNVFKHVSPALAGRMMTMNTLIMFPWMTRCMLHYGDAWPMLWHNISHGYEIGQQSDMVFAAKFEPVLHLTPAEAREALGIRGFQRSYKAESTAASLVFGEGREIF